MCVDYQVKFCVTNSVFTFAFCQLLISVTDFCQYTALLITIIIEVLTIINNYSSVHVGGVQTRLAMVTPVACNLGKAVCFVPVGSH